jgi:hypothetical protein
MKIDKNCNNNIKAKEGGTQQKKLNKKELKSPFHFLLSGRHYLSPDDIQARKKKKKS